MFLDSIRQRRQLSLFLKHINPFIYFNRDLSFIVTSNSGKQIPDQKNMWAIIGVIVRVNPLQHQGILTPRVNSTLNRWRHDLDLWLCPLGVLDRSGVM